ncbi:AAA family ATPase [Devosia sp. A449]
MTTELITFSAADLLSTSYPPREVVLDPWLRQGETVMVWAATGVGKTWFILSLAVAISGGGAVGDWTAPKPRKVLIIDGEMHQQDLADRLRLLGDVGVSGHDMEAVGRNLHVLPRQAQDPDSRFHDITDEGEQNKILRRCRTEGIEVLIIDNLSTVADGLTDENDATAFRTIQGFMLKMKQAGITTILVHHARKDGRDMRGSTALQTTFEVIIGLQKPSVAPHGKACFTLEFTKVRAKGNDTTTSRIWTLQENGWDIAEDETQLDNRVLAAVQSMKFPTQQDIADHLGEQPPQVTRAKKRLIAKGQITADGWAQCLGKAKELRDNPVGPEDDLDISGNLENSDY